MGYQKKGVQVGEVIGVGYHMTHQYSEPNPLAPCDLLHVVLYDRWSGTTCPTSTLPASNGML